MQKSKKFSDLVAYFEDIATKHVDIQHVADNNKKKHFYRFELDEVLSGLNGINYPALIMEGYRFGFGDEKSDNVQKKREGAFILLSHVKDPGDYHKIHEVWDELEAIGDDIIAKIKADKRVTGNPVAGFDVASVNGSLLASEMGNHYGIRFTFGIDSCFDVSVDKDKWILESES